MKRRARYINLFRFQSPVAEAMLYLAQTRSQHDHHSYIPLPIKPSYYINTPSASKALTSPPASLIALTAATLILLRRSLASFSRLAFVFELPLGATPVRIRLLSWGVKLTKPTVEAIVGVLGGWGVVEDLRRWCEVGGLEEGRRGLGVWVLVAGGCGVEVGEAEGEREGGASW